MIPAAFDYIAPETLDEALTIAAEYAGELKIMAGGQSLIPLLKLRLAEPALIMDLARLRRLCDIEETGTSFRVGALVTHDAVVRAADLTRTFPVLADAGSDLADPLVRNRGTFGGAIAHGDPAGDWPAAALSLDATVTVRSIRGERHLPIANFYTYLYTTQLADDEILTHVEFPKPAPGTGSAYAKQAHPASGYSLAAAGVSLTVGPDGSCQSARVALTGISTTPLRALAAEAALRGKTLNATNIQAACAVAADGIDVMGDSYAPRRYRTHLVSVITRRAIDTALARAHRQGITSRR